MPMQSTTASKGVVQKIKEIVGMQADRKSLALLGDRQVFQRLIIRLVQTVCKNLRDFYALGRVFRRLYGFRWDSGGRCGLGIRRFGWPGGFLGISRRRGLGVRPLGWFSGFLSISGRRGFGIR